MILESDNTYDVLDRNNLANSTEADEMEMKFDQIVLQKVSEDGRYLRYENINEKGDNDSIYFMGIVPDKDGRVFSILTQPITGRVFKQNPNQFSVNIAANVTNINPNYTLNDYVINFNGEKYILMCIIDNEDSVGGDTPSQGGDSNQDNDEGGASFTWIFYILGGAGTIGGGYLVIRLRKKVRVA